MAERRGQRPGARGQRFATNVDRQGFLKTAAITGVAAMATPVALGAAQGIGGMEHGNSRQGREGERAVIDAYIAADSW